MSKASRVALPVALLLASVTTSIAQPRPPRVPPRPPRITAPEFDGRSAGTAVALIVGGALVLSSLRTRRPSREL